MSQTQRLDAVQGRNEQRSEMYGKYIKRVAEFLTPQCAKTGRGVASSASKQAARSGGCE